jgi:hypothetical protein
MTTTATARLKKSTRPSCSIVTRKVRGQHGRAHVVPGASTSRRSRMTSTTFELAHSSTALSVNHAIGAERPNRRANESQRPAGLPMIKQCVGPSTHAKSVRETEQRRGGFMEVEPQGVQHPAQNGWPCDIERRRLCRTPPEVLDATRVILPIEDRHIRRDEQFLPHALAQFLGAKNRTSDEVGRDPAERAERYAGDQRQQTVREHGSPSVTLEVYRNV